MSQGQVEAGSAVEYVGEGDGDHQVYAGHPGRVLHVRSGEISVSWVNGPSWGASAMSVRPISEAAYVQRGDRLARLQHPLRDEPVPRFNAEGHEWPEGVRPGVSEGG